MSRQVNLLRFMTPWNKPADDWAREKAAEMHRDGYDAAAIIAKLDAYGIGFYAARALAAKPSGGDAQ
jgi:hypothetical protein